MTRKFLIRDSRWIIPLSLAVGGLLGVLDGQERWWMGGLAYALVLLAGLFGLAAAWRWAGADRRLAVILALALFLRLGLGVAMTLLLPAVGYDEPVYNAGYLYIDAYDRDTQAWELADSARPIWAAFDKNYSLDQYGGMLAMSAWLYRALSPDAHRPWLMILLGAWVASLGVAFLWKAARQHWGESVALPAAWIFALFPEAILLGSAQLREPFLMAFLAIAFWGLVDWLAARRPLAWFWMGAGYAGMLLFSPGVALFALLVMSGLFWLSTERNRKSWHVLLIVVCVFLAGFLLLAWAAGRLEHLASDSPIGAVFEWLRYSVKWDVYLLQRDSGWVQKLFNEMPEYLHLPFVTGFGMAQPVLPAALFEPAPWLYRLIGIFRAVGWYALIPFLAFGLVASWKTPDGRLRRSWLWLGLMTWAWIIVCAIRAGGDQWDNPRYRAIFLFCQALLAGYAWAYWRARRNPWLVRFILVEVIFLAFFMQWYAYRYLAVLSPLPFGVMVGLIVGLSLLVLLGGWLWDRRRPRKKKRT